MRLTKLSATILFCLVASATRAQLPPPNLPCKAENCHGDIGYEGKTFDVITFYRILSQWKDKTLTFRNCLIDNLEDQDDTDSFIGLLDDYYDNSGDHYADLIPDLIISYDLQFAGCKFQANGNSDLVLQKLHFKNRVILNNCSGYGVEFRRCVFERGMDILDLDSRYLKITGSYFGSSLQLNDLTVNTCEIDGSKFSLVRDSSHAFDNRFGLDFQSHSDIRHFSLTNNEFVNLEAQAASDSAVVSINSILSFRNFQSEHLKIVNCNFECTPFFQDFSAKESFIFRNNQLQGKLVFDGSPKIPNDGSIIPFESIEKKLGHYTFLTDTSYRFLEYVQERDFATLDARRPWVKLDVEKDILPIYNKLLAIYNATGDLESYNQCYRKLKKIEEEAAAYKYNNVSGSLRDWFEWQMDSFLRTFSEYGTDPIQALYSCALCILIFTVIYMIFPSEEDNIKYQNIQMALHRYIDHFSNKEKKFYSADEIYKQDVVRLNAFKRELVTNKKKLPPVISFFGHPFFRISLFLAWLEHRIRSVITFNIYQDWVILNKRGRMKTGSYISLSLVGFLLWGLAMRIINATTLSLNAFVTLGYGEISARGIARYLCVLEGLLGWFFLSLFSVSLIGQILQ
jgi:hypothetical protein